MNIKIPEVGESVREALLAKWFRKDGDLVTRDESLCEIETDKITLDVHADATGVLSIQVPEGTTVRIGAVVGTIYDQSIDSVPQVAPANPSVSHGAEIGAAISSPAVRREMREQGIDPASVTATGKGGRISIDDLFSRIEEKARRSPDALVDTGQPLPQSAASPGVDVTESVTPIIPAYTEPPVANNPHAFAVQTEDPPQYSSHREERKQMSPIRKRISERMVAARQQTAMLTTFNEADLSHVKALRERHRDLSLIHI